MKSLILFMTLFIFPANAVIPSILGNNLIEQTCKQTPYYDLCVWTLITDPHSFDADVKGLAKIMVKTIEAKASHALHRINHLIQRRPQPQMREALEACAYRYSVILKGDCPQALEALHSGDYKFAEKGTYDAANEAMICEEEFTGKSPLADKNMMVHDVSIVAASIVKTIINS